EAVIINMLVVTTAPSIKQICPLAHHPLLTRSAIWIFSFERNPAQEEPSMNVKRITPVLLVQEIEPLIPFWAGRLGFAKTVEVPDGNKLGFVIFQKDSVEVMYQTYASVEKDAPAAMSLEARKGPT